MGKQIEQMEQQSPQLLFFNDNNSQTGPPYYVDLFIEAGEFQFFLIVFFLNLIF